MIFKFLVCCCCALFAHSQEAESDARPRIAVIGGGIGGTSAVYFLDQLFHSSRVSLELFEMQNRLGGRLRTVNVGGHMYEAGGSIVHPKNLLMVHFAKKFGLQRHVSTDEGTFGIWNGEGFSFLSSAYSLLTYAKLLWRYGYDLIRLKLFIRDLMMRFQKIYTLQDAGSTFDNVEDMLGAIDPEFAVMLGKPAHEYLAGKGFKEEFIKELIQVAVMTNYGGQTVDNLHSFVVSVAMAGAEPGLWSILGGNELITEAFVREVGDGVTLRKNHLVVQLRYDPSTRKVGLKYREGMPSEEDKNRKLPIPHYVEWYDAVVVAMPLLDRVFDLQFVGFPGQSEERAYPDRGPYHQTVATLIQGDVSNDAFQVSSPSDLPRAILSCNASTLFASVGQIDPCARPTPIIAGESTDSISQQTGGKKKWSKSGAKPSSKTPSALSKLAQKQQLANWSSPKRHPVYKIFSRRPLSNDQVSFLFQSESASKEIVWQAYPDYSKFESRRGSKEFLSFYLGGPDISKSGARDAAGHPQPPVFYVNSIEWAASAMEMSLIGARNVALLIKKRFIKSLDFQFDLDDLSHSSQSKLSRLWRVNDEL